jgi:hypothetical protein
MSVVPQYPVNSLPQATRNHSAEEINRAMARFPLIVRILGELGEAAVPLPGDDDVRHGCERALTAMLSELARIEVAPAGKLSKAEEIAQSWLSSSVSGQLIDVDKLQRMQQFIDRILNSAKH